MNDVPEQPLLPLDERFREAEQYTLDFTAVPKPQPKPALDYAMDTVCIHNCNACPNCDDN